MAEAVAFPAMAGEQSLEEQTGWLRNAQRARVAARCRHVARAAEETDWAAVAAGIPGEAPGWGQTEGLVNAGLTFGPMPHNDIPWRSTAQQAPLPGGPGTDPAP